MLDYIAENKEELIGIMSGLLVLLLALAKLTPSKKDDSIINSINSFFNKIFKKNANKYKENKDKK